MDTGKKILVTGAAGNLGRQVATALIDRDMQVIGGTTRPDTARLPSGIAAIKADYTQPATIEAALKSVNRLFLVAPPLDPEAPAKLKPVIDMAKKSGVTHIVFNSALGVDQNDNAPLRVVEKHLMASGVKYTILRPNFFMENFSTGFLASMIAQGGIYLAAGDKPTSFISTKDIAAVAAAAFAEERYDAEYNLTGPAALNHEQVAGIISEVSGKNVQYHPLSEEAMCQGAREQGMPEGAVAYLAVLYQAVRNGWTASLTDDVEEAIGRRPISFNEFAHQSADCWR
jgi:uncharacterized protein YbjT (DUF2867 family)